MKTLFNMIKADVWGWALNFFIIGFMIWVLETGYFAFAYGYHFSPINTYEFVWDKIVSFFWYLSLGLFFIFILNGGNITFGFQNWKLRACIVIMLFIFIANVFFHIYPSLTQK